MTKEQEIELGRAIQKSSELQQQLKEIVLLKKETMAKQVAEQEESQDEWFALMGHGSSRPFLNRNDEDYDDDDDEDLASLSVMDSASWYQQSEVDDDLLAVTQNAPSLEQFPDNIESEWSDSELDYLTEDDVQQRFQMSKIQLESILLDGAVARDTLIRSNVRLVVNIAKRWAQQQARIGETNLRTIYQGSWDRPSLDEAIQDGIVGLIEATERFDPERSNKFSTYATVYITNEVRKCFQRFATPGVRIPPRYHIIRSQLKSKVREYHLMGEPVPPFKTLAKEIGVSEAILKLVLKVTRPAASIDAPLMKSSLTGAGKAGNVVEASDFTLAATLVDPEGLPEDGVEWSFLRQSLELAMAKELAPHERDVVRLRLGLDDGVTRSVRQVAEEFGGMLSMHEIRRTEKRAFRKLRSPNSLATYKFLAYLDFAGIDISTATMG